ncbi:MULTISPECIES: DoxX family protein [Paenibacillus]|uniref:DoxX family protein n=1 Tax=Paenibacillus TaxID=44249 RepID=UPI0022B86832|nr:DoxX family protein [Paenibacillus caseinilyticus]MCZ8523013.1 DoxX family protein [Paenibacillus caseinilyticus]
MKMEMKTNTGITIANDISKARLWTARAMSGIVVLFMLFDGIGKIAKPAPVIEGTLTLGFTENHLVAMGVLGLFCTILYALPRTRFLGALLLTGYLGGAVAAHLRVDHPLWSHMMFPVYVAVLAWGALWLTDRRLRHLLWERE